MHNSSVNVWVDEIVPCLKESATQEIKETVVFRIETKSFLEQFNEKRDGILIGLNYPKMWRYMPSL